MYRKAGYAVVIVGDLNSRPGSLPHKFLTMETGLVDSWEQLFGRQDLTKLAMMDPVEQLNYGCTTCDSNLNTWRAYLGTEKACRLDYALIDPDRLQTVDAGVRFTERIANVGSFSDHFAYSCTLKLLPKRHTVDHMATELSHSQLVEKYKTYKEMILCIENYMPTAQKQKYYRGLHFIISIIVLIGCVVATTFTAEVSAWSSIFWVLFAIVVAVTGTIDGIISFLFGRKEIRALMEVQHEVLDAERNVQNILQREFRE